MNEPAQQVDAPSDFGDSPSAVVSRWVSELELSEKQQRPWVERGRRIVRRYVDDRAQANDVRRRRFALLWANIQTLAPAIYARTPTAVVSRRWRDADPVGRTASEVIERALNFSLDAADFADIMTALRDEYLLVGRGQAWVRYVPQIRAADAEPAPSPDGEVTDDQAQYDEVVWEEAICDHVHWEDFGTNPARTWSEVRFVWRRCFMTRDELVDRFGDDKGAACPLDWKADGEGGESDKDVQFAKACVYEIWDKVGRQVLWICKAYTDDCLDVRDDPLGLKDFFPCPRPLLASCGPDSIIPTPDYIYYESQAQEINELTRRIGLLTDALKVRGFYAGTENGKLTDLLAAETNTLVPIDSWAALADKGGMAGVVQWFPVDMVAGVLKSCIETRQQMLEDVFQITGIADIMRGDTDPDETASAQQIKATWGSSRVRDKQRELSRFARDLLRIMGEVVAQKFSTDTLTRMTGVQLLPSPAVKQALISQAQMQAAAARVPGAPPFQLDPELARMLNQPTWAEIEVVLRDNAARTFRIEIETDSTIEPNDQDEKQRRVEFVQAVGLYLEKTLSVVQLAPEMLPVVVEGLKFLVRGFRVGREMEDVVDQALDQLQARAAVQQPAQPNQGPDPQAEQLKAQAATTNAQANVARAQAQQHRAATESFKAQSDAQIGMAQIVAENQRTDADRAASLSINADQMRASLQQALLSASQKRLIRDINNDAPMETPTP